MIEHIVLLKPRAEVDPAAVAGLWSGITALATRIPGIVTIEVGNNVSPEGLGRGFALGFVVRFADATARDAYLPHPDHLAVVPLVHAVADEVLVFDLELAKRA